MRAKRIPRYVTTGKEAFEKFKAAHPNSELSIKEWRRILKTFNTKLSTCLLETGERVKISPIGSFAISRKKTQKFVEVDGKQFIKLPIDWPKTLKAGKRVYLMNNHSEGFRYWCQWFEIDARFTMSCIWGFKLVRNNSRMLAKYIKNNNNEFRERYREWGEISNSKRSKI